MALLSYLPMNVISSSSDFSDAWKRYCSGFGISSQSEMRQWSHIDNLTEAILALVSKEKDQILFAKPLNAIFAAGSKKKTDLEKDLGIVKERIKTLLLPDEELDEKEEGLSKANKRLTKKIDSLGEDIESELRQIIRKGKNELEDIVDASFDKMRFILENDWPAIRGFDYVKPKIETEIDILFGRKLKRATREIADQGKRKIDGCVSEFFSDAEDILMRYLPDFDSRDFVKSIKNQVMLEIEEGDLFDTSAAEEEDYGIGDFLRDFFDGATFGVARAVGNLLSHGESVSEVVSVLNKARADFAPEPFLESAFHGKEGVLDFVRQKFITELIDPLLAQIKEIREQKETKAAELEKLRGQKSTMEQALSEMTLQLETMSKMRPS